MEKKYYSVCQGSTIKSCDDEKLNEIIKEKMEKAEKELGQLKKRRAIIYVVLFIFCMVVSLLVFKNSISGNNIFAQQISTGAIFATFGSAIVSIASIKMEALYRRFEKDIEILFKEIDSECKWSRWPFLKRWSHKDLYNKASQTMQMVDNTVIEFDAGVKVCVVLPTTLEDFYDLNNEKSWANMHKSLGLYEEHIITEMEKDSTIDASKSLLLWDCVYDIFCVIKKYLLWRYFVICGTMFIVDSVILAFGFSKINGCMVTMVNYLNNII